jgi:hypothetical protein
MAETDIGAQTEVWKLHEFASRWTVEKRIDAFHRRVISAAELRGEPMPLSEHEAHAIAEALNRL